MRIIILPVILLGTAFAQLFSAPDGINPPEARDPVLNLMQGKVKTNRTVLLEAIVAASPAEVYRLWTSEEGIKKFFAPAAHIDTSVGGRYQVIFAPSKDPEGDSHGTKGARILKLVPDRELAFEWITFAGDELMGKNAPPYAPPTERNVRPLPTWVELSFDPIEGEPDKTHVRFAHYGFREGEKWEQSYRWFGRAWKGVLDELVAHYQNRKAGDVKEQGGTRP
jgi:uncharacterized protein YndB with AHSA1/START domain